MTAGCNVDQADIGGQRIDFYSKELVEAPSSKPHVCTHHYKYSTLYINDPGLTDGQTNAQVIAACKTKNRDDCLADAYCKYNEYVKVRGGFGNHLLKIGSKL